MLWSSLVFSFRHAVKQVLHWQSRGQKVPREKVLKWTTKFPIRLSQGRIDRTAFLITGVLRFLVSDAGGKTDTRLSNFAKYNCLIRHIKVS